MGVHSGVNITVAWTETEQQVRATSLPCPSRKRFLCITCSLDPSRDQGCHQPVGSMEEGAGIASAQDGQFTPRRPSRQVVAPMGPSP